jgi:lipoate---protein ligase
MVTEYQSILKYLTGQMKSMAHFAEQKVPGGKLVSARLVCGDKIEDIKILGDFFIYPEEALFKVENSLKGRNSDISEKEIEEIIEKIVLDEHAEMVGITPQSVAHVIRMAIKC